MMKAQKPNKDKILDDGKSELSTDVETHVSCCI